MSPRDTAPFSRTGKAGASGVRLAGIDAARGLALLGMMATHVLPTFESDAQLTPTWVGLVFSGRAAALFAVLAGIGLALSTGKERLLEGAALWGARPGCWRPRHWPISCGRGCWPPSRPSTWATTPAGRIWLPRAGCSAMCS